jgi:hypothetical protein
MPGYFWVASAAAMRRLTAEMLGEGGPCHVELAMAEMRQQVRDGKDRYPATASTFRIHGTAMALQVAQGSEWLNHVTG